MLKSSVEDFLKICLKDNRGLKKYITFLGINEYYKKFLRKTLVLLNNIFLSDNRGSY